MLAIEAGFGRTQSAWTRMIETDFQSWLVEPVHTVVRFWVRLWVLLTSNPVGNTAAALPDECDGHRSGEDPVTAGKHFGSIYGVMALIQDMKQLTGAIFSLSATVFAFMVTPALHEAVALDTLYSDKAKFGDVEECIDIVRQRPLNSEGVQGH